MLECLNACILQSCYNTLRKGTIAMNKYLLRIFLALGLAFALIGNAQAHPLGNFTVNQYSRVVVDADTITVHYVVDMAEIPAFQAIQSIDANQDGQLTDAERQAYLDSQQAALLPGLLLSNAGTPLPLTLQASNLEFPDGQGGLKILRLTFDLQADHPAPGTQLSLEYRVNNFAERLGWREIVIQSSGGVTLAETNALADSISNELRSYPEDSLASPLDMRSATFTIAPGGVAASPQQAQPTATGTSGRADDRLAALVSGELTPATIAIALVLAFILGAGHALTPGHGKTVVAAYLVGARGTARQALFLGLATTLTHTAGVFLLGFVVLGVSQYLLPEQIYPWLEFTSGALVVIIGVVLFRSRLAGLLGWNNAHHTHDHSDSDHEHGPHTHTHDHDGALADWADAKIAGRHVEQPNVSWRSLLALGISGGLIPCPSALVVLLGAVALGRVGFGMVLILAFSLGLAAVLTSLGLLLVYARGLFEKLPTNGLLMRALPVASAVLVTIVGCVISYGGLVQAGVL
jgi:nickel/cobalt transporter (NicO) family protein